MDKPGRTVLVTGASGFVGRWLVRDLASRGWAVRAVTRNLPDVAPPQGVTWCPLGDLVAVADWGDALAGVEAVVHLAGRAHVMEDDASDPLAAYRAVNVDATRTLARQAAAAGVRRFVFMSSAKAVGESSTKSGLDEQATPAPEDAYGITKREAEVLLLQTDAFASLGVTVLRPPLVYGPGVRANFARLLRMVASGMPLPFARVDNVRSLVYLGNLSDAVCFSLESSSLASKACFVTDGDDVSIGELIRRIALAQGRSAWLLPVPAPLLRGLFTLLGRRDQGERLLGTLSVRMEHLPQAGWKPPYSMAQGLAQTVTGHLPGDDPGST